MNDAFEKDVWSRLIDCITEERVSMPSVTKVLFNVTYSYAIVRKAAVATQSSPRWENNEAIKALKFTDPWIVNFLQRQKFRRRKGTREEKIRPSEAEVIQQMELGQLLYRQRNHTPSTTWNCDETAFTYAIGPTHLFCSPELSRASSGMAGNTKLRITALPTVNGAGDFGTLRHVNGLQHCTKTGLLSTATLVML